MLAATHWRGRAQRLPVILLLCVALNQQRLVYSSALSPWAGGGFGMFSTTDTPADRHLHAYAISPALRRELTVTVELEEETRRALALPSEHRLGKLTRVLREDLEIPAGTVIEVQVWVRSYDPKDLTPHSRLLRHFRDDHGSTGR